MVKLPLVKCACNHCGKEFERHNHEVKRCEREGRRLFCSKTCSSRYYVNKAQAEGRALEVKTYICEYCGKEFKRKERKGREHKFCNWRCHSFQFNVERRAKLDDKYDKDMIIKRIDEYVMKADTYRGEKDILRDCAIPYQRWVQYGFKAEEFNTRAGKFRRPQREKAIALIKEGKILNGYDLKQLTGLARLNNLSALIRDAGYEPETMFERKLKTLKDDIIAFIKETGHQVNVSYTLKAMHIDFQTLKRVGATLPELHALAGVPFINRSSMQEQYASLYLMRKGITVEEQKAFPDLINPETGRQLYFDIFIPASNTLIEIDGAHHYEDTNVYGSYESIHAKDLIKNDYAKRNNIKLSRIKVYPASTFKKRFRDLCKTMGVVKPL